MAFTIHELALNCILSSENNFRMMKKTSYMITTLFHGSSKVEKHISDLNAKGCVNLNFKNVNVESDYLRFHVINNGKLFGDKHVGTINVRVSELVSSPAKGDGKINQEASATYELVKSSKKQKSIDLNLSYKLSMAEKDVAAVVPRYVEPEEESKHVAAAIGNDIGLLKMVASFRIPFVSFNWS